MNRRRFLKTSGALACGFTGATSFSALQAANMPEPGPNILGPRDGFSPQVGTLVSMLNWMRASILQPVQALTMAQLDHLHDEKANSIGALLLHLAAIERLYQINTFEGKKWGDVKSETEKAWGAAARLGDEGRKSIKGHELAYYLGKLREVREHTLAELRKRDDTWLMQIDSSAGEPTNNYCKWFHVCEHESHHNGQVTWLKARLPA
ncbi:MAG TPA: DinB family protein [Chthoniobacterales bacterium]|nr:DinB family protein [Chthoniobacterales bacterium]